LRLSSPKNYRLLASEARDLNSAFLGIFHMLREQGYLLFGNCLFELSTTFATSTHTFAPNTTTMSSVRPMTPADLLKFNPCNLDHLTETYNIGFYLDYFAKWPELCMVIEDPHGSIEGYSQYSPLYPSLSSLPSTNIHAQSSANSNPPPTPLQLHPTTPPQPPTRNNTPTTSPGTPT